MSPEEILSSLPTQEQIDAALYRRALQRDFKAFVLAAWEHADPARLEWAQHLDALCSCLQAVAEGRIRKLLINIPPGHAKSLIVSVLWPAWRWARDPKWSGMFASYEMRLVMRDAVKARSLIESDWYIKTFRTNDAGQERWALKDDQNTKQIYVNTLGGMRQGTSVGQGTGYRGDTLVVDDPLSVDQAYSEVELQNATRWFFETMATRFNDMATSQIVVIMQRLHERDVSGEILERERSDWQLLNLPARFEPDDRAVVRDTSGKIVFADWRQRKGDLLFPAKFPEAEVKRLEKSLGPYGYAGQLQQKPSPLGGGALKKHWFNRRWTLPGKAVRPGVDPDLGVELIGKEIPLPIPRPFVVTDAAFKGEKDSDRVAIGVWILVFPNLYLLDLIWDQLDFGETIQAIKILNARWRPTEILVEDKANGSAIINTLSAEIAGVEALDPGTTSKHARILAGVPYLAAGNVYYPSEPAFTASPRGNIATIRDLIGEAAAFPKGRYDDAIDMQSYAINLKLGDPELAGILAMGGGDQAGGAPVQLPALSELLSLGSPAPPDS